MEEFGRCAVCARTPLVGEGVIVHQGRGGEESSVCDLCLDKPRARSLGEPARRERVRSAAGEANVRRILPRPVAPDREPHTPAQHASVG